jgi:hypothetical protein
VVFYYRGLETSENCALFRWKFEVQRLKNVYRLYFWGDRGAGKEKGILHAKTPDRELNQRPYEYQALVLPTQQHILFLHTLMCKG